MSIDPPIMIFILLGRIIYFSVLDRNYYLFYRNYVVYVVNVIAPIVNRRLRPTKLHRKIFLSLINKKNNPRVISLNAHPISTLTVLISQCSCFV